MSDKMSSPSQTPVVPDYKQASHKERLVDKVKNNPMVPLGIAGMAGMVGYGAMNYKNRGSMSTSVYLMHLRVKAQSMVVGAVTIGITYTLLRDYVFNDKSDKSKPT